MEARLSGGTPNVVIGRINPKDLNEDTYEYYCRLYLIERIYEIIPATSEIEYKHVAKIINSIDTILFKNLYVETNKILLLNQIYSLFMQLSNEEISRVFLYERITHLASYDPAVNTEDKYNV